MVPSLIGHLFAFFIIAMGCHGELARTRPAPAYLSSFYVSLSFGGMLGGLFAGLLAPYIFSWIAEYPILVALAVLCRPWIPRQRNDIWFWVAALGAGTFVIVAFLPVNGTGATVRQLDMAVLALAALSILFMRDARKSAVIVVLALIVAHTQPPARHRSGAFSASISSSTPMTSASASCSTARPSTGPRSLLTASRCRGGRNH